MRERLLLLCVGLLFVVPTVVWAHGSNVFESGHEAGDHAHHAAHADGPADTVADEFEELHEQIERLETRLAAHDQRTRLTDILGGVGYIAGIAGVAYYYLGARRKQQSRRETEA